LCTTDIFPACPCSALRAAPFAAFLHWALPRLDKRWAGFRSVTAQVESRIVDRLQVLGRRTFEAYRDYVADHPAEWDRLDALPLYRHTAQGRRQARPVSS
jgi:hypothetical protein